MQATSGKGAYAQVAFAYEGEGRDDSQTLDSDDEEEDEDEEVSSSEDSEDDEIENIGKDHGVQRFNWLVHLDRKAKEEEKRQKEAAKGDPAMVMILSPFLQILLVRPIGLFVSHHRFWCSQLTLPS